jgi:hypothetical protein
VGVDRYDKLIEPAGLSLPRAGDQHVEGVRLVFLHVLRRRGQFQRLNARLQQFVPLLTTHLG